MLRPMLGLLLLLLLSSRRPCLSAAPTCCMPEGERRAVAHLYEFLVAQNYPVGGWSNLANSSQCLGPVATSKSGSGLTLDVTGCHVVGFTGRGGGKPSVAADGFIDTLRNFSSLASLNVNNFLSGPFPTSIGKLRSLKVLIFLSNGFTGTIPSEIGFLSNLNWLVIQNSPDISGTLPDSLGNLKLLTNLFVSGPKIGGSIPAEVFQLNNLQIMILRQSNFSGSLPSAIRMAKLQILNLEKNHLSGELQPAIFGVSTLKMLLLSQNSFRGHIPMEIRFLMSLKSLALDDNKFMGTLPNIWDNITGLTNFEIQSNNLIGGIPSSMVRLKMLKNLDISDNKFTSAPESIIGKLTALTTLNMSFNSLAGPCPFGLSPLLEKLSLANNQYSGTFPSSYASLSRLKALYLQSNRLTGELSSNLSSLTTLELLSLSENSFSGPVPIMPKNLVELSLEYNNFSGTLSSQLGLSSGLKKLNVRNNQLSGKFELPNSLFVKNPSLFYLNVFDNKLTGTTIDSRIGLLTKLEYFLLGKNSMTGSTLPSEIGSLKSLKILNVRNLGLVGTLPTTLGSLTSLVVLNASGNALVGGLPSELGNLRKLQQLSVYSNMLQGTIPASFSQLTALEQLFLNANSFQGSVDLLFQNNSFPSLVFLDISTNTFGPHLLPQSVPPKLRAFTASVNCFNGMMDITQVCHAQGLEILILDGLSDNFKCVSSYLGGKGDIIDPHNGAVVNLKRAWDASPLSRLSLQLAFTAYRTSKLTGTLPSCLFQLPSIQTIHLAANNLRGQLPADIASLPKNLTEILLSYNYLSGPIPLVFQHNAFQLNVLDLSFNRFRGSGLAEFNPPKTFYLHDNRLSGVASSAIYDDSTKYEKVSILEGNLIQCKHDKSNIPDQDVDFERYQCDSDNLDQAATAFFSCCFIFFAAMIYQIVFMGRFRRLKTLLTVNLFRRRLAGAASISSQTSAASGIGRFNSSFVDRASLMHPKLRSQSDSGKEDQEVNIATTDNLHALNFIYLLSDLRAISIFYGAIVFLVLLPLYLILKTADNKAFSMFELEYSWVASGIFMTGWKPAFVLTFVWTALIVVASLLFYHAFRREDASKGEKDLQHAAEVLLRDRSATTVSENTTDARISIPAADRSREAMQRSLARLRKWSRLLLRDSIIIFISCSLSLSLNLFYIYEYQFGHLDSVSLYALQIFVAAAKIMLHRVVPWLKSLRIIMFGLRVDELRREHDLEILLTLFGVVVAPFVATVLTDKTCFFLAFKGPEVVHLTYEISSLAIKDEKIVDAGLTANVTLSPTSFIQVASTRNLEFHPPFIYYFQCSSSLIRIYAPPQIIGAAIKMFLSPVVVFLVRYCLNLLSLTTTTKTQSPVGGGGASAAVNVDADVDDGGNDAATAASAVSRRPAGWRARVRHVLIAMTPAMLRSEQEREEMERLHSSWNLDVFNLDQCQQCCPASSSEEDRANQYKFHFVDVTEILLDAFADLLLMLTFGLLCPLLALILLLALVMRTTSLQYMCESILRSEDAGSWDLLNLDCAQAWLRQKNVLFRLRWLLVVLPPLFLTMFVFDTASDDKLNYGADLHFATALTCCIAILPLCVSFVLSRAFPRCFETQARRVVRGSFGVPADIAVSMGRLAEAVRLPLPSPSRQHWLRQQQQQQRRLGAGKEGGREGDEDENQDGESEVARDEDDGVGVYRSKPQVSFQPQVHNPLSSSAAPSGAPIVGIELRDVATPAITAGVGDVRDSIPEWETEDRRALT